MTIGTIIVDCASLEEPCAEVVDQIARLKLAALRCNVDLRLDNANQRLLDLIELCGLAEVLRVQPRRQAE